MIRRSICVQPRYSECLMLQRVLSDKDKVPMACRNNSTQQNTSAGEHANIHSHHQHNLPLVRRLTGGVPGGFANFDTESSAHPAHKVHIHRHRTHTQHVLVDPLCS
jgi:hypothetical protein